MLFKDEKIRSVKRLVLCIILFVTTFFFLICTKKIINHDESYYSVKETYNEYKDLSGKQANTSITAIGDDITKLVLYTNDTEVNGTVRYSLMDQKNNILFENSLDIKKIFEGEENPLELSFQNCSLVKGEKYKLLLDFSSFDTSINILYSDSSVFYQQYYTFQHRLLFLSILDAVYLCFLLTTYLFYKNGFTIKNFLIANLFIGVIVLFIMPPANRDDEFRHFLRAYELSTGEFKADLVKIPEKAYGNSAFGLENGMGYYLNSPKKVNDIRLVDCNTNYNNSSYFAEVNSTLNYDILEKIYNEKEVENYTSLSLCAVSDRNPIFYFPMTMMIFIGRLLKVNGVFYFYLARIGQLLLCTLLGVLSLKLAPKLKTAIYLATFAPPIVLLRSSCNTDGLLISMIIAYIALLYYVKEKKIDLLSDKSGVMCFGGLLLFSGIITLMKLPYIIVCFGSLFVMTKDNVCTIKEKIKKYKYTIVFLIFVGVFIGFIMQIRTSFITSKLYSILPKEHIVYMFDHPKYIVKLFLLKFAQQLQELYKCMNTVSWFPYSLVLMISMIFSPKLFSYRRKSIFLITFVFTVFSIILVGYTLTPPDYGSIWGITYRYLLPSLFLLILCLPLGNEKTDNVVKQITPLLMFAIEFSSISIWFSTWWLCL